MKRKIMILLGRSGCGKSVIAKRLMETYGYRTTRTATTRDRRDGEAEDAYYFLSHEEFHDRVAKGEFAEWAVYNKKCYGTPRKELETENKLVIVLTPEGAEAIKKAFPDAFVVHVETDLKTAAVRAIEREENLTPATLQNIAVRGCTDEFLFKDPACDFTLPNPIGTGLDDLVQELVNAHNDWMDKQELSDML